MKGSAVVPYARELYEEDPDGVRAKAIAMALYELRKKHPDCTVSSVDCLEDGMISGIDLRARDLIAFRVNAVTVDSK